jgi:hypothetical protein
VRLYRFAIEVGDLELATLLAARLWPCWPAGGRASAPADGTALGTHGAVVRRVLREHAVGDRPPI